MKVKVRFLEAYNGNPAGAIRMCKNATDAGSLVADGIAEYCNDDDDGQTQATRDEIVAEVQRQLKGEKKSGYPFGSSVETDLTVSAKRFWCADGGTTDSGFKNFGEFLLAVKGAGSGEWDDRLKALSGGVNTEGGFTIPVDVANELYSQMYQVSPLLNLAKLLQIEHNTVDIPFIEDWDRSSGRFGVQPDRGISEGTTMTEKNIVFGKCTLRLKKLGFLCTLSAELLSDSRLALQQLLPQKFAEIMAFDIENQILNGLGAGEMLGIFESPSLISVTKETDQPADTIIFQNLCKIWSRLTSNAKRNCIWLANSDTIPELYSLSVAVGTGGSHVFLPSDAGATTAPASRIFGRPLYFVDSCATLGDANDICAVNMQAYAIARKQKAELITIELSEHIKFAEDQVQFRIKARLDGQSLQAQPITPAKSSDTQSNFVSLGERA